MKIKKFRLFTFSIKNKLYIFVFCSFILCLIVFSNTNLVAAKQGLLLWANSVVPTLFPFFVATELLNHTNFIPILGKYLNRFMRPIFKVPGEGAYAFLMGLISGYPIGAKIVCHLREEKLCTKNEGERMLAFTNNSGPLFIVGTVGISLFGNSNIGFLFLATHIFACITVGILFGFFAKEDNKIWNRYEVNTSHKKEKSIGEILGDSIKNAISTILLIGGFIVIFSIIISILNTSHILDFMANIFSPASSFFGINVEFIKPILAGIVELTNGVKLISDFSSVNLNLSILLSGFLLGFGGISILLQVASIVSKTDLSMKKYILGKLLQGIISSFYIFIAIYILPIINISTVVLFICLAIVLFLIYFMFRTFYFKKSLQKEKN